MTDEADATTQDRVAEGCEKAFGDNKVLKGVSFGVVAARRPPIIGPSGSGKTTLLAGLMRRPA